MYYSFEEIDRTIFERIRLKILEYGFYPDITDYVNDPQGLQAAKDALRQSLPDKQLIELFGVGNSQARGETRLNMITIDRKATPRGNLGGFPEIEHEKIPGPNDTFTYTKRQLPDQTRDIWYEIRLHPSTAKFHRIMADIIAESMGTKRYMNPVKDDKTFDTSKSFFIEYDNEVDVSDRDMLETLMTYKVRDVFIAKESKVLSVGIVPLVQVIANMMAVSASSVETTEMDGNAKNFTQLVIGDGELPAPLPVPEEHTVEIRDQDGNVITTLQGGPGVFYTVQLIKRIKQTLDDPAPTIQQEL